MAQRLIRDDFEKFQDYNCLIPARIIYFGSEFYDEGGGETGVDFASTAKLIKNLLYLDQKKKDVITLHYSSPGGDWDRGIAAYDCISGLRSSVRFIGYGCVRSMGSIIIQACKWRFLTPKCKFMIHAGDSAYWGTTTDFLLTAKDHEDTNNTMIDIYYKKMIKKNPRITKEEIKRMCEHDYYMSGEDAVKLGLADKVIGV